MTSPLPFKRVMPEQAEALLVREGVQVLDARDPRAYAESHLPGAVLIRRENLQRLLTGLPKGAPIFIYCDHGNASQTYAGMFADFRFHDVSDLIGGYEAWRAFRAKQGAMAPAAPELAQWLSAQGFPADNIHARIANATTPLMHAARLGDLAAVQALLAAGARPDERNADGNTALWLACFADSLPVIDALVAAGADLDNQNDNGATCLMYAASAGKGAIVRRLLDAGADVALRTLDDFSALDMAASLDGLQALRAAERARASQEPTA